VTTLAYVVFLAVIAGLWYLYLEDSKRILAERLDAALSTAMAGDSKPALRLVPKEDPPSG